MYVVCTLQTKHLGSARFKKKSIQQECITLKKVIVSSFNVAV